MYNAKVENLAMTRYSKTISVNSSERACINCIWYEQYYRETRTNVCGRVSTSTGYCILHEQPRGALRQPCRDFERPETKGGV